MNYPTNFIGLDYLPLASTPMATTTTATSATQPSRLDALRNYLSGAFSKANKKIGALTAVDKHGNGGQEGAANFLGSIDEILSDTEAARANREAINRNAAVIGVGQAANLANLASQLEKTANARRYHVNTLSALGGV